MKTITITKLILSGCLKGSTLEDTYKSNLKDNRVVGMVYKGITHKYKILSIKYIQEIHMITTFLITLATSAVVGYITGEILVAILATKFFFYDLGLRMDIQTRRLKNL